MTDTRDPAPSSARPADRKSAPADPGGTGGPETDGVPFEELLEQLEGAVEDLERGDLGLDDALARYETGVRRLVACRRILQQAEGRFEILRRSAEGGWVADPLPGAGGGPPAT